MTVDVGAVEAADVNDPELVVFASEFGVAAADGDVVEVDVAVGMPAGRCDGLIQQKPRSGVGAALDDKHSRAAGQLFDSPRSRLGGGGRSVALAEEVGTENEGGVPGVLLGRLVVVFVAHVLPLLAVDVSGWWSSVAERSRSADQVLLIDTSPTASTP